MDTFFYKRKLLQPGIIDHRAWKPTPVTVPLEMNLINITFPEAVILRTGADPHNLLKVLDVALFPS